MTDTTRTRPGLHTPTSVLVRRLYGEAIRPYRGWIVTAFVFMGLMAGASGVTVWLLDPVVNQVFIEKRLGILWYLGGAVFGAFVIKGASNYIQAVLMSRVGLRIVADYQNRLYAHITRLNLSFFHDTPTGTLTSRFMVDINAMRNAVSNVLTGIGKDFLMLIAFIVVLFIQDWQLALIALVIFPIAILPIVRIGRRMRKVTAGTQSEMGLLSALLEQTFQGIRVVKAYGMESYESSRVGGLVERIFGLNMKAARTRSISSPLMETLGGLAVAAIIVYGGYRVIAGQVDAGSFMSFIAALLSAYEPAKRLANLNASLQEGLAGAERLFDLLDTESTITDKPDAKALQSADGDIRLEDVSFSYRTGTPALSHVSIAVPAGNRVALVGTSGAGKSTALNLIPRFYDVDSGHVLIGGQNVADVTQTSLLSAIALVSQEVMLFDDTVRANIAYGRENASKADIIQAAKGAAAHDFIEGLPEGYDTTVGEQGVKLSGGQRQRLAIARAMLKNAPILLLDEATSALDTESERQVQAALDGLMAGRTTLVIAHRLSTVQNADRIYVLDGGRVVEDGTHAELIARGGAYAKLHAVQFTGDETAA